jgi:menaquinone-dependent protoporphyrinogen oxidase
MATIQIVYQSRYGQTHKIAEHIAALARRAGHKVDVTRVAAVDTRRLSSAGAFVVLAPVFYGQFPPATRGFIADHAEELGRRPSVFVSVSGGAGSSRPQDREEARQRALDLVAATRWNASLVASVAGAVAYPAYGFFTRLMMKMISKRAGRPTDTSRTHELTDWADVERLARDLLALVEPQRPATQGAAVALV